jgi:signal transduction histidine kinase
MLRNATGRVSIGVLVACLLAVILGWGNQVSAAHVVELRDKTIHINANVGEHQIFPPTITKPDDGEVFTHKNVDVQGSCMAGLTVVLYRNNVFAGSTTCHANNKYNLTIDLVEGSNELVAQQYDGSGQISDDSNIVTVYYKPKKEVPPLIIDVDYVDVGCSVDKTLRLPVHFIGGEGPYAVSMDWGDGTSSVFLRDNNDQFYANHVCKKPGIYIGILKVVDHNGTEATLQYVIIVRGPVSIGGVPSGGPQAGEIPGPIGDIAREVKKILASPLTPYIFPLLQFVAAVFIMGILLWQILLEFCHARLLLLVMGREKETAEDKLNFLELCAHFLRTPTAIIATCSDVMQSMPNVAEDIKLKLAALSTELKKSVEHILKEIEENPNLREIVQPNLPKSQLRIYLSPMFWLPIIISIILTVALNMLVVSVGGQTLDTSVLSEQAFIIAAIAILLYTIVRERSLSRRRNSAMSTLLAHRDALDKVKNQFVIETRDNLARKVTELGEVRQQLPADVTIGNNLQDGIERLQQIVDKFTILATIQSSRTHPSVVSSSQLISGSFTTAAQKIAEKKIKVTKKGDELSIKQDQILLGQVVASVLDNAAEYSKEGGEIIIEHRPSGKEAVIRIADEGAPFSKNPEELFGMFERGASSIDFTHGGMGLSLYLNRLIMRHLGGSITAKNIPDYGAEVTLKVPTKDVLGEGFVVVI